MKERLSFSKNTENLNFEQESNLVQEIEKLPIGDSSQIDLILTWKKLKPATQFNVELSSWEWGENPPNILEEDKEKIIQKTESLIKKLNLFSLLGRKYAKNPRRYYEKNGESFTIGGGESQEVFVAQKEEDVQRLKNLWEQSREKTKEEEKGKLFGYPESAAKAFQDYIASGYKDYKEGGPTMLSVELHSMTPNDFHNILPFAGFRFSRHDWEKELKIVKQWAEEIQKTSPNLYTKRIKEYHERINKEQEEKNILNNSKNENS